MTFAECVKACGPGDAPYRLPWKGDWATVTRGDLCANDWHPVTAAGVEPRRTNMTWSEACERAKTHWVARNPKEFGGGPSFDMKFGGIFLHHRDGKHASVSLHDIDATDWQDAEDQT